MDDEMPLFEAAREIHVPYNTAYSAWRAGRVAYEKRHGMIWVRLSDLRSTFQGYKPKGSATPTLRAVTR